MPVYSKILLAYDGSESSENALAQSVALLKRSGGDPEILIVAVAYMPVTAMEISGMTEAREAIYEASRLMVDDALQKALRSGLNARAFVKRGVPHVEIAELALDECAELIVMGRRGMGRLERMLVGSVTERVVAYAPLDVLVIPRDAPLEFNRILVATDGSPCGDNALDSAVEFATQYGINSLAAVTVLDVNEEFMALAPDAVEELVSRHRSGLDASLAAAEGAGIEISPVIVHGNAPKAIAGTAGKVNADIVFVGTHGRTGLARMLMGSVSKRVIGLCKVPVMVTKR